MGCVKWVIFGLTRPDSIDTLNKRVVLGWQECDTTYFNPLNIKYNIHIEIRSLHPKSNAYTSSFQLTFKIT